MEQQKWTERPITWGAYAILCGITSIVTIVILAVYYAVVYYPNMLDRIVRTNARFVNKFTTKN